MDELEKWLDKVYQAEGDRETLDRLYDEWARDYDQHIWASGNPYIAVAATMTGKYVPDFNSKILDVGCGTGNMAQILYQTGYQNIDGLDPSEGMLTMAEKKGIYRELHQLSLSAQVDLPNDSYDAVIGAGVLTHGHAPPDSLDGMLRLTRSGGVLIFSLSTIAENEYGFGVKMDELTGSASWRLLERSREFRTYPFSEKEAHLRHYVYVFQKS